MKCDGVVVEGLGEGVDVGLVGVVVVEGGGGVIIVGISSIWLGWMGFLGLMLLVIVIVC